MREFVVAVAGTAVVVAALASCSSNKSSTNSSSNSAASGPASAGAGSSGAASETASAGQNKVVIDGQDQDVANRVLCNTMNAGIRLTVGMGNNRAVVDLSDADPPEVKAVHIDTLAANGMTFAYESGTNQGNANVTKGGNTYTITGTVTGGVASDPTQQVSKSFEIDANCP
jgi:ipoprotein LpqH